MEQLKAPRRWASQVALGAGAVWATQTPLLAQDPSATSSTLGWIPAVLIGTAIVGVYVLFYAWHRRYFKTLRKNLRLGYAPEFHYANMLGSSAQSLGIYGLDPTQRGYRTYVYGHGWGFRFDLLQERDGRWWFIQDHQMITSGGLKAVAQDLLHFDQNNQLMRVVRIYVPVSEAKEVGGAFSVGQYLIQLLNPDRIRFIVPSDVVYQQPVIRLFSTSLFLVHDKPVDEIHGYHWMNLREGVRNEGQRASKVKRLIGWFSPRQNQRVLKTAA